jgi:hypothetical protein
VQRAPTERLLRENVLAEWQVNRKKPAEAGSMKTPHKLSVALCTSKKESVAFVAFALSGEDGTARSSSNTAAETKARSAL